MPHGRGRLLLPLIQKALKHSPIVGILGQRQTGKTTLLESLVPEGRYLTLDQAIQRRAARGNPETFLDRGGDLLGIDECQLAPELFPALKERVRIHKNPGQFLLTGSVRFTSRKLIRESLTGRIVSLELLPLCLAETHEFELGDVVKLLRLPLPAMQKRVKQRLSLVSDRKIEDFLNKGGLPGICFFRDATVRADRIHAHLDTILRRDLQLVFETTLPYEKLLRALQFIALHQGQPLSFSELGRVARISAPSLRRLIPAFESLFLIRRVETLGDRTKDCFFIEDQGAATFLARTRDPEQDLLRFVFSQCLAQVHYIHGPGASLKSYESRGGARVPLILDIAGTLTGLVPVTTEVPDASAIASAESFLSRYPKAITAILTPGNSVAQLGPRLFAIPYRAIT